MKQQFGSFVIRWFLNSLGLWVAVRLFGNGYDPTQVSDSVWGFLLAGLVFSIANAIIRPFIMVLSLPAILLTLGLFTVVVNGFMVYVSLMMVPGMKMTFWNSVLTGLIISLLNYTVGSIVELRNAHSRRGEKI